MNAIGYMVWSPEGRMPTVIHETFNDALREAERLKRQLPSQRFYVMSPVDGLVGAIRATGFDQGRAEGVAQAHREIMWAEAAADRAMCERDMLRAEMKRASPILAKAGAFQSIVADALLWFDGFSAAFTHRESCERPRIPDRDQLRQLNSALQELAGQQTPSSMGDEMEIPF